MIEKRKSVQEVQAWLLENRYGGAASNAEVILKDGEANAARAEFESLAADICDEIVKPRRRS